MAMPTKAASKWSRLQAAKTKVTRATRRTGDGGGEEGTERANGKYLPKHILLHFRTLFMFILYGDLPGGVFRAEANIARPCAILAVIHRGRACPLPSPTPSPYPPSLLRPTFLPSVLALSPLIIWAGPLFYGRETFGWWVWAWLARWLPSAAEGRTDCACIRAAVATPLVLNRESRPTGPAPSPNPPCCSALPAEYLQTFEAITFCDFFEIVI